VSTEIAKTAETAVLNFASVQSVAYGVKSADSAEIADFRFISTPAGREPRPLPHAVEGSHCRRTSHRATSRVGARKSPICVKPSLSIDERVCCAAARTSVHANADPDRVDPVRLRQGRSRMSGAATYADVPHCLGVDRLGQSPEVQCPTIDAGSLVKRAIEPPGKPHINEERPFRPATQDKQTPRPRTRRIARVQKGEGRTECPYRREL
jgi:hypothetical protein